MFNEQRKKTTFQKQQPDALTYDNDQDRPGKGDKQVDEHCDEPHASKKNYICIHTRSVCLKCQGKIMWATDQRWQGLLVKALRMEGHLTTFSVAVPSERACANMRKTSMDAPQDATKEKEIHFVDEPQLQTHHCSPTWIDPPLQYCMTKPINEELHG